MSSRRRSSAETELREFTWNPLDWVYLAGDGLFTLQAREFAPLADRLASTAGRLETLPAVFDAARETLVGSAGRPVARFHTETALRQIAGIDVLIADALASADEAAPTDAAVAALQPRLTAAAATAREAVAAFETHLRDVVLPASEGEGRLGEELFNAKMRTRCAPDACRPTGSSPRRSASTSPSAPRWSGWRPSCGRPGAPTSRDPTTTSALVRGVLDAIAAEHPDGRRPARLLPGGERPDRGLLP